MIDDIEKYPATPENIILARTQAGDTQSIASDKVHRKIRIWQNWEAGTTAMPLGLWELYLIKINSK